MRDAWLWRAMAGSLLGLAGCSTLTSERVGTDPYEDGGLIYRLPRRDVVISVSVTEKSGPTWKIGGSVAYADQSTKYVARFHRSHLGKVEPSLGVGENGLLTSSQAKRTSDVQATLVELARSAGALHARGDGGQSLLAQQQTPGNRTPACGAKEFAASLTIDPESPKAQSHSLCQCSISVERHWSWPRDADQTPGTRRHHRASESGIYYRQERPYLVTIENIADEKTHIPACPDKHTWLVQSPNGSETEFLPIHNGLFANNSANFTFVDGMPTSYGEVLEGEALAVAKIPFAVVGAFFNGVGETFKARQTATANEAALFKALMDLQAQQHKNGLCTQALAQADKAGIDNHCK